jgi:tetratricopeptide (TPR) repeat protein
MSTKPVIFISYAHADEPEKPAEGEVQWLTLLRRHLQPAVKDGIFALWVDRQMMGGAAWDPEIEQKLRACDIFILLVSPCSMASHYIVDKEIAIIRERQTKGEHVHFYPLLLTPTPDAGLNKVKDKNLRPRDAKPLSSFSHNDRLQQMTDAANEIARIAQEIVDWKGAAESSTLSARPAYVHMTGLPETAYERLVGREKELQRLDDAWADRQTNILSLIAGGGSGKSSLVNEWLKNLRADDYRGAEMALGWSFYSQGSKERATSAEPFLDWALEKLGVSVETTSAGAKGDAIAEAIGKRRVLLVLDGVEPLQHGPGGRQGELKDLGLRSLLRHLATMPPTTTHGLVLLTSRLAVRDIARFKDGAAPILDVEKLSDEAGAALLRDNGVWGTDSELKATTKAFDGHPLALGLLASFLTETQFGDVRRRDHISAYLADRESPQHDHAWRVMESYDTEWLADRPVERAIMSVGGLFDRPASGDCLRALRAEPAIEGLTEAIVNLDEESWRRAIARLRAARLLSPQDPSAPDAIDAHPLVREWFGARLERTHPSAWRAAHGRLYDHLRDTTREGDRPGIADLAPLYQAIAHGCRAGRYQEALREVYQNRIYRWRADRVLEFYSTRTLGTFGSNLAAISWFFDRPYETPVTPLTAADRSWVLGDAAFCLSAQGRLAEAIQGHREGLRLYQVAENWGHAARVAGNLVQAQLLVGEVAAALTTAQQAIIHADQRGGEGQMSIKRAAYAAALHVAGRRAEAEQQFVDAEQRRRPQYPLLHSLQGYWYCDLLISKGDYVAARDRATKTITIARQNKWILPIGLDTLTVGRAHLGLALAASADAPSTDYWRDAARTALAKLGEAVEGLQAYGDLAYIARGLLARAALCRGLGDWDGVARDLNEAEEIAEPGPMKLVLCDVTLERVRLAFARITAFAPLHDLIDPGPPRPLDANKEAHLTEQAMVNLVRADSLITECGYHRRDDELAELQAVLKGARTYADLPPRV